MHQLKYLIIKIDSIFLRRLDFSYNNNGSDASNLKIFGFAYSPNINIFENRQQYSNKLYLTNNLIYLNAKVFPSDISNNDNIKLKNNHKKIFLSLSDSNNCCTGLTHNLLNNDIIKLKNNNNDGSLDINKIYINNQSSYKTYNNSRLKNYFLNDISYDYHCTHINSYRLDGENVKEFSINLHDELNKIINNSFNNNRFYDFSNIYSDNINEFLYLNGRNNSIINDISYLGIDKFNDVSNNIKFQINDLSYYYTNRISNPIIDIKYDSSYHKLETLDSNLASLYVKTFDKHFGSKFKFNYNNDIIIDTNLYIIYDNGELNDLSYNLNDNIGFILNNYLDFKITFFITPGDSDIFEKVDCVYIWNKKEDRYRYPNNNIDICRNFNIDSFSSVILSLQNQLGDEKVVNYSFVPKKNGSNLTKKQIQSYIYNNDIPKLLSIKPYDPNFIDGRGFINQTTLDDTPLNRKDKIERKYNSQKHSSVKNINVVKKNNYADLLRNPIRNRGLNRTNQLLDCNKNNLPKNEEQYNTIFKFYK